MTLWASTDFVVPPGPGDYPIGIVTGPDGNLWFANSNSRTIGRINPLDGTITRFPVPGAVYPFDITNGPDGNLWFTDKLADFVGRITVSGQVTTFPLAPKSNPIGITAGPDGALWFTEFAAGKIGRIATNGALSEFGLANISRPYKITNGPDGNLWFTSTHEISRITPQGTVTTYPLGMRVPHGITAAPDGNLWFTDSFNSAFVGRITPQGAITNFFASMGEIASGGDAITVGPDGNIWFNNYPFGLTRVTLAGAVTSFPLSYIISLASGFTAGNDGNLWITGYRYFDLLKTDASGHPKQTYALNHGSAVNKITTGPDGKLWFTETNAGKIGSISIDGTIADFSSGDNCAPVGITTTADAVWFTSECPAVNGIPSGKIYRRSGDGTIAGFPITSFRGDLAETITVGTDGDLWVADDSAIERFTPTVPPMETDFATTASGNVFTDITSAPDGNLWFIDQGSAIGRITTAGVATEFGLPGVGYAAGLAIGPDGNFWTNLNGPGVIHPASITPLGSITVFGGSAGSFRESITAGPDGHLWSTDSQPSVGIISTDISGVAGMPIPPSYRNSGPKSIIVGPDHKLWFTEFYGSRIGRMSAIHGIGKNLSLAPGASFNGEIATFIDGTPTATAADMSASVDWGDDTSSPGIVSGPTGGPFSVSGSHVYNALGNFQTSIKLHESVDTADYVATGTASVTTATTTALTSSANPAAPGDMVTLTATVSTSIGTASGTVMFFDFGNQIGSAPLNTGVATLMTASLAAGPHAIVAIYGGDLGHVGSSSADLNEIIQGVNETSTTVSVAASGELHFRGPKIVLTATVTPGAGSAGGTVDFYDGNRFIASAALDASGQAAMLSDALSTGAHAVRAAYSGDANFGGSISTSIVVYRSARPR